MRLYLAAFLKESLSSSLHDIMYAPYLFCTDEKYPRIRALG